MKEKRMISQEERDTLINTKVKSFWSLGRLFYIMALLLPFLICMIITRYYTYLYVFMVLLLILMFSMFIYPAIFSRHLKLNEIYCFESKVLSCRMSDFYYYLVEIEGLDGNYLEYKFPVSKKLKKEQELIVVMVMGDRRIDKYYLLDKKTNKLLTSKRTRFDLID